MSVNPKSFEKENSIRGISVYMSSAITFALLGMLFWGFWAILAKVATRSLSPETAMIFSYLTSVGVAVGYIILRDKPLTLSSTGIGYALVAGVFAGAGAISYYIALDMGKASTATTVTGLYFAVAAVLGVVFLGESLKTSHIAGIGLAVVAVFLLAQ